MKVFTTLGTIVTASSLLLVAPAPAQAAGGPAAAPISSSVATGDVLFWSRTVRGFWGHSIVKASAAAPTIVATVLAGSTNVSFSDPEVSRDGTKLAYVKDSSSGTSSLEVRDLATGGTTVLAVGFALNPDHGQEFREPTWSPSGNSIAYLDVITGHPGDYPIVKEVAASGGASRTVQEWAHAAAWRPDGKLTVARYDPGNTATGLWVTGATPADAVMIPGSDRAGDHAWSPNGAEVAFNRPDSSFGPASLETLPAAGGTATVIVPASNNLIGTTAWSGDGQRVYFTQDTAGDYYSVAIKRVPRTGGAVTTVVSGGRNVSVSVSTNAAPPVPSKSHDFTGDGYADVIGRMSNGDLRAYYGNGLGLSGYRRIGTGWSTMTAIFTPGDFNGDGYNDVIGRLPNGDLRLYTGVGGGAGGSTLIGTGFGGMTALFSPGDFTGDGHPDVIARNGGELRLYVGTGVRLTGGTIIGPSGWNTISAVFSPGDFNLDGKPDVIGRLPGGELVVYYGNGVRLSGSSIIGTGWNGLSALNSPGDFNLDGKPDVIGRLTNGDLRLYYGTGTRLSGYRTIGTGWTSVNPIL